AEVCFPLGRTHLDEFAQELLDAAGQWLELTPARRFVQPAEDARGPGLVRVLEDVPRQPEEDVLPEERPDHGVEYLRSLTPLPRILRPCHFKQQVSHPSSPLPT